MLVESLLLAGVGCLTGLLFAQIALPGLLRLAPIYVPRLDQTRIDLSVLLFSIGIAGLAILLFGLAPALQASRVDPNENLRMGGSRGILGGPMGTLRQMFVVAEVALCVVLLITASLLLKSFAAMTSVDLGFRPERLLVAQVSVPALDEKEAQHANDVFFRPLLGRLSTSPQVRSAALARTLPGDAETRSWGSYIITGQTMRDFNISSPSAGFSVVSPGYFQTLSIPLVAGRAFSERDEANAPLVAIISESLARRSFPHRDPIGQKILCGFDKTSMKWMTVVGVVGDVRENGPNQPPTAEIYMPYLQHPRGNVSVVVRNGSDPLSFAQTLQHYIRELDPEASVKLTHNGESPRQCDFYAPIQQYPHLGVCGARPRVGADRHLWRNGLLG